MTSVGQLMNSLLTSSKSPNISVSSDELEALERAARKLLEIRDVGTWAENHYFIADTQEPIVLMPHQKAILRYALARGQDGRFRFNTVIYSCPKKSGKTAIAGLVAQWAAETWGRYGEILCIGNDADQARERAFKNIRESIELSPGYIQRIEAVPGRWKLSSKQIRCLSTGTIVKAIATDYQGEAGANPILTVWTELWGFIQKASLRFWAEMAPSPTRPASMRWIETYAGYEGESQLLWNLYETVVLQGRQLTAGELNALGAFGEAPNPSDLVPCWVNESARMFAYWDQGQMARRMPWQLGEAGNEYYASEAATQTPQQMTRLHDNKWISAESSFIEMVWWDACEKPLPLRAGEQTPLVVALDASVTGDCFGIVGVSRDPDQLEPPGVAVRFARKWNPPASGKGINYAEIEAFVRQIYATFNVVEFAYDPYQLHDMAMRMTNAGIGWWRKFGQGEERLIADKNLYDLIVQRRIRHDGDGALREHIANCNAKQAADEDTRLRIIKKAESRKIDLAVCLSMAARECLRLNL